MRAMGVVVALIFFMACVGEDPDTVPSSSSSSGASGGPSARVVRCNEKDCATGEVCCLTFGNSSIEKAECTPEAACSQKFLACDGTADCADGEICCVKTGGNSVQWGPSACAKECLIGPGESDRQLCKESSECASGSCLGTERSVTPTGLKECTK